MNLLIDWGNTQLKFICVSTLSQQSIAESEVHICVDLQALKAQLGALGFSNIDKVLVSSVRDDETNQLLTKELSLFCQEIIFAKTSKDACGIECAYEEPQYLGIDRWLAVIAGSQHFSDRIDPVGANKNIIGVISVGTAITLDLVSEKAHLGGHILPGQGLMFNCLKQTGRVWASETQATAEKTSLGQSTSTCVAAGIDAAIEGYLSNTIKAFENEHQIEQWLIHGGGGAYWKDRLSASIDKLIFEPKLVFEGLDLWYQENQS